MPGSRFTKAPDRPSVIQGQDLRRVYGHAIYVERNLVCTSDTDSDLPDLRLWSLPRCQKWLYDRCTNIFSGCKALIIMEILLEAAGVGVFRVLTAPKLLIPEVRQGPKRPHCPTLCTFIVRNDFRSGSTGTELATNSPKSIEKSLDSD